MRSRDDPYAVYRRLRERDPVHRMRLVNAWVLTRYEHADAMLRDHKRFTAEGSPPSTISDLVTMLDIDPAGSHAAAFARFTGVHATLGVALA